MDTLFQRNNYWKYEDFRIYREWICNDRLQQWTKLLVCYVNSLNKAVAVNVHFKPMPMLIYFMTLGYNVVDYPQAYDNYKNEISLPIYPQLTDEQVDYVIESVVGSYKSLV